jgi:hypothetical protein
VALAQELRVPGAGRARHRRSDPGAQPLGRADRHRRLPDDEITGAQVRQQGIDRGVQSGQVGARAVGQLGRPDAEEMHRRTGDSGRVGGEPEPTGRQRRGQQRLQLRLVDRRPTGVEPSGQLPIRVDPDDGVSEVGEAGGVDGTEVAAADDGDQHDHEPEARS